MRDMKMKEILLQKNNIVFESQIKRLKSFKERATKIQDAVQLQKEVSLLSLSPTSREPTNKLHSTHFRELAPPALFSQIICLA